MGLVGFLIMGFIDIIEYIVISKKLIDYDFNKKILNPIILLSSLVMGLLKWYLSTQWSILISGLILILLTFNLYRKKLIETIYVYILSTVIILSIQVTIVGILGVIGMDIEYNLINGLIAQGISLLLIILVGKFLPIHFIFSYLINNNKVVKVLTLNALVILISIWFYWNINLDGILANIISIAILSAGIIYVNLVFIKEGLRNKHKEEQLKIYKDYLPVIDELMNELRAKQHEFDNHIQALRMLTITSKNFECIVNSMNDYIDELEEENDLRDLVKLDNKVLAGFIYSKIKRAEELGIDFEIIIEDYGFRVGLKDYELVEVIGNLINNAFETGIKHNSVVLELKKEEDMNVIEVRNKHPYLNIKTINKFFMEGVSTKSSTGRGFGLYNVKEITNKYNGKIEVYNKTFSKDNYLVFRVLFSR